MSILVWPLFPPFPFRDERRRSGFFFRLRLFLPFLRFPPPASPPLANDEKVRMRFSVRPPRTVTPLSFS